MPYMTVERSDMNTISEDLLDILVVPGTERKLHIDADSEGSSCLKSDLGDSYEIRHGVPILLDLKEIQKDDMESGTFDSFNAKWKRGASYREATTTHYRAWFCERYGLNRPEDVGALLPQVGWVLDAGTAHGRDADLYSLNTPAKVVGLDFSEGIFLAQESFGKRENLHFVRGDMTRLPFRPDTFDFVACDQAIHHTPDTRKTLGSLVTALKDGGTILFYVYKKKAFVRELVDTHLRELTTALSEEDCIEFSEQITDLGKDLSDLNATLTVRSDIPLLGIKKGTYDLQRFIFYNFIKCYWNDTIDYENNVLTNFDWYHPPIAHRHTAEEVRGWCVELDLKIDRLYECGSGISVVARKAS